MAIKPETVYPGKINAADANYPQGSARNITVPSDGTGTPLEQTWLNDLWGFLQALLAEDGSAPSGTPDTALVSQYLDGVKVAALAADYTPLSGPAISLNGFLDRQGIWAEDETGIQQANDYLVTQLKRDAIQLPPAADIALTAGLVLDASYASLNGHGARLDASAIVSGAAVEVEGTVTDANDESGSLIENLSLIGGGVANGWDLRNSGGGTNGPSRILLRNISTEGFAVGEFYNEAVYPIEAHGCSVRDCTSGLQIFGSVGTEGRLLRVGGGIYDCAAGVTMIATGRNLEMLATLIKNNAKIFTIVGGHIQLIGCPVEAVDYAATPITIATAGAGVLMVGGSLELTGTPPGGFDYWVDVAADTFFESRGTRMDKTSTITGRFALGAGRTKIREAQYDPGPANNCRVLNSVNSMVSDMGFEAATIEDDIFITGAGVAITDRHTAGSFSLQISSAHAKVGTQSLELTKGAAGTTSKFALAVVPVSPFDKIGGRFYWRALAGLGSLGPSDFNFRFVRLGVNSDGVPVILNSAIADTDSVTIGTGDSGWTLQWIPDTNDMVAPEWATHFIIEVDVTQWDGSGTALYFDDINVNIVG